jgi:hypothetical protein
MAIQAAIEARLLGKRLLTLNAEVTVLPSTTNGEPAPGRSIQGAGRLPPPAFASRSGSNGSKDLASAAALLESGAAELRAARQQMP